MKQSALQNLTQDDRIRWFCDKPTWTELEACYLIRGYLPPDPDVPISGAEGYLAEVFPGFWGLFNKMHAAVKTRDLSASQSRSKLPRQLRRRHRSLRKTLPLESLVYRVTPRDALLWASKHDHLSREWSDMLNKTGNAPSRRPKREGHSSTARRELKLKLLRKSVERATTEYPEDCRGANGKFTARAVFDVMRFSHTDLWPQGFKLPKKTTLDAGRRWERDIKAILDGLYPG